MDLQSEKALDRIVGMPLLILLKPIAMAAGRLARRDHALEPRGRVMVIKMLGGGSLVIALPALLGLRRAFPSLRLSLVTTVEVANFGRTLGVFDEIIAIDRRSMVSLVWSSLRALARSRSVDTVLDFEVYSKLTSVFSLLTAARNRLGFYLESVLWRRPIQTHLVYFNRSAPVHLFYERMTGLLGAPPASYEECRHHVLRGLGAAEAERRRGIAIGVGCSNLARERMLDAEQWLEVISRRLLEDPALSAETVSFLGGPEDAPLAETIAGRLREAGRFAEVRNLCGTLPLEGSLLLLAGMSEFWGIDSALIHYARLLGPRCVSFWGPTSPASLLKPAPIREDVQYAAIPCSPCVHVAESPPCEGRNLCMTSLLRPLTGLEQRGLLPVLRPAARPPSP